MIVGAKFPIFLLSGALVLNLAPATQVQANCGELPEESFVEILLDGKSRIGSGVVITDEGHVLTALHVVDGFLETPIRIENEHDVRLAAVLDVSPLYDVALLKIARESGVFVPASIATEELDVSKPGFKFCHVGYGISVKEDGITPDYDALNYIELSYRQKEKGYIVVEGKLKKGFSGGGVFVDGDLYGINLSRSEHGTKVLPIHRIASFLLRNGLEPPLSI